MELLATINGIDLALFVGGVLFGVYAWTRPRKPRRTVPDLEQFMAELEKAVETAEKEKGDN